MATGKWWLDEQPVTVTTERNVLRYYPGARKLQVSQPDYEDKNTGEMKQGKTVSLDLQSLAESPGAVELLQTALQACGV